MTHELGILFDYKTINQSSLSSVDTAGLIMSNCVQSGGEGEGGGGSVPVVRSQAPALGAFCARKV